MVSKSIERAQKKVEENNFAIRKRLLEYDDVMNVQREHIYKRRRHALFGERLDVDINQMFAGLCREIVEALKAQESYEDFKLEVIATFGFEPNITAEEFEREDIPALVRKLYAQVRAHYDEKNQRLLRQIMPFLKEKYEEIGDTVRNIEIVFTDHKKLIRIAADFAKVVETEGKELIRALERTTVLALIDQEWKEHLREMDDLRQSVQMAVHEQKDPLIIYKFEAFELFKELLSRINRDVTSFLMKATLPQAPTEVREARQPREKAPKLQAQKPSSLNEQPQAHDPSPVQRTAPIQSTKIIGRNDKVTVRYHDGRVVKDVKYKKVEQDILNNRCVIIEE
jgi:preprotein translocase subunit SecA